MRHAWIVGVLLLAACGGNSPTAPSPTPTPTPPRFTGTVTETLTGAPVAGFSAVVTGSRVTVSAPGYLTRDTANGSTVDLIRNSSPFDLTFYRQFVRGTFNNPIQPLRRQRASFRLFVRTVDESGQNIDTTTLNVVTNNVTSGLVESFSGGAIQLLGVEQGSGTRIGQAGWVTVRWISSSNPTFCGNSPIGGDYIELVNSPRCGCRAGQNTFATLVRHEIGHVMGFWHTDNNNDLMFADGIGCENNLSERERYHAAIAYKRPIGNRDPDIDP